MKFFNIRYVLLWAVLICSMVFAQTDSTKANGNWNSAATWKSGNVPTGSGVYIIRSTDSVYFSAATTITGTIKNLSGKIGVFDSSKIVFSGDAVYEHAANGGMLPKATWNSNSTCLITGVTGNVPNNSNQSFYNLTWNCPGQSGGLNLGFANTTINGNIRVINTNTSTAIRLTATNITVPGGRKNITINGNIYVDSSAAFFTATGSGSPNDTFSVTVKGNIISKGNFQLANGSGGLVTWLVAGNINCTEGSFTTQSSAPLADTVIFNGTSKQTFTRGGAVTSSNIRYVVKSGAIVDFDTSTIGGSALSTFRLEPGATIVSGRSNGFKGNINNGGGTTLDTAANYEYAGIVAQSDTTLPSVVNNLTINNAAGFTLKTSTKINGTLALKAGQLDNTIPFTLGKNGTISYLGGSLKIPVTSVRPLDGSGIPKSFFVDQNYPNPFNPSTTISYGITNDGIVSVKIYNLLGQEVAVLFNGFSGAGVHSLQFNADQLSSGMYLYRVQAGNNVEIKRMMLVK